MIAADHTLRDAATAHGDAVLRLIDILRAARGGQYELPLGEKRTMPFGLGDPTGETATSARRLRLRAGVLDATATLEASTVDFIRAADRLEELVEAHATPDAREHAA